MNAIRFASMLLLAAGTLHATPSVPWPLTPTGETHSLLHSYGDFHAPWVPDPTEAFNFHYGIDLADPTPEWPVSYEAVKAVCTGVVTRVEEGLNNLGWFAIVDDDGTPSVPGEGWFYGHIQGLPTLPPDPDPMPQPYPESEPISLGAILGYIAHVYQSHSLDHLHFMRVEETGLSYSSDQPAVLNPLFWLDPAPSSAEGYDWTWQCFPSSPSYHVFVLPQYDALTQWQNQWVDVAACKADALPFDALNGAVDFFLWFCVEGEGENGPDPFRKVMPQRFEWWLERELADGTWTNLMGDGNEYYRYLFDFGDIELGGSDDSDRYRQLYFRYNAQEMIRINIGYICCLTNVNDEAGYDGIDNITENCWQTDMNKDGTGTTENALNSMFPDGVYRIRWKAFAFDGTSGGEEVTPGDVSPGVPHADTFKEVTLANYLPFVTDASIVDYATDLVYWDADWEVVEEIDDYSMHLVVNSHIAALPVGQTVEVTIHFSETMDTNCPYTIILEHESGYPLPMTGGWSSTAVDNDTWSGTAQVIVGLTPGTYSLFVACKDMSGEWLTDPADPGSPFTDDYHRLDVAFGTEPGWSASVHAPVLGSPKLADMDLDGDLDVVVQCSDGWIHVLDDDGTSMTGWPVSGGWSSGNPDVYASPAIVDLSGSPSPEVLAVHPSGCNGLTAGGTAISPWSGIHYYINRWHALSSPVAGDFDEDGYIEYALGRQQYPYSMSTIGIWARKHDGSGLWELTGSWERSVSSTPTICDATGDGNLEVVFISDLQGFLRDDDYGILYCVNAATKEMKWSANLPAMFYRGAVTAGNLDNDNAMEIIVTCSSVGNHQVRVFDGATGGLMHTLAVDGTAYAGSSIADVDGDGDNDIVLFCSDGMLYCWDGLTGTSLSGFPVDLGTWTMGGVSIGDIDLDEELELVMAGRDGKLYAVNHDGTMAGGFPITVSSNPLSGQPALGDIDGDGRLEIIFGEEGNSVVHCYQLADNSACAFLPWPQFQRDARNTGTIELDTTNPEPPTDFNGTGTLVGSVLTVNLSWTLSVNDPYNPNAVPPADVVSYHIYRKIPSSDLELVGTVSAGTDSYTDVISFSSFPPQAVGYFARAWDGTNESAWTDQVKIILYRNGNIARDSRIREITNMAAIEAPSSASITGSDSRLDHSVGGNCRVLTDGNHDTVYMPSSSARCVEVDLGAVFDVTDVAIIRSDLSLMESMRLELSTDGTNFRAVDSGRARYVRVYGTGGASEIEVMGTPVEGASIPIEIVREEQGFFMIASAEEGTPMTVSVFDLAGRRVWDGTSSSGEVLWNRRTSTGTPVPTGVYLLLIETDGLDPVTSRIVVR